MYDRQHGFAGEMTADRRQRRCTAYDQALNHGSFRHIGLGKNQLVASHRFGRECNWQRTAHRPQRAFQTELTQEQHAIEPVGGKLAAGGENPDGDWQVECAAALLNVCRSEIDGDASEWQLKAAVAEGGSYALTTFLDGANGQSHGGERRQAIGDIDLDIDGKGLDAEDRGGTDAGEQIGLATGIRKAQPTSMSSRTTATPHQPPQRMR
jgi:hypothetical protein